MEFMEARQLADLLARIHRDGGHYQDEHGTDKAVKDADKIVAELYGALEDSQHALKSLCQWLLHRFGPDSPEGQEALARLKK